MTIGEKISARRKELKLTLEDIGKAVGVGKSTVKKWESGYIANMRRDKISALAKILQMNPTEFINPNIEDWDKEYDTPHLSKEAATFDQIKDVFGEQAVELVHIFVELNEEGQEKILDYAGVLERTGDYKKDTQSGLVSKEV